MSESITHLTCQCGEVHLKVIGRAIVNAQCLCSDCQKAGAILQKRLGSPCILDENGATRFVLFRKDRVVFLQGQAHLKALYLEKDSTTKRTIASCCNTPIMLDFSAGHWFSVYGLLWPKHSLPALELRTMTRSRPKGVVLTDDVPNPNTHTVSFYFKLFFAWAKMGFRVPKLPFIVNRLED